MDSLDKETFTNVRRKSILKVKPKEGEEESPWMQWVKASISKFRIMTVVLLFITSGSILSSLLIENDTPNVADNDLCMRLKGLDVSREGKTHNWSNSAVEEIVAKIRDLNISCNPDHNYSGMLIFSSLVIKCTVIAGLCYALYWFTKLKNEENSETNNMSSRLKLMSYVYAEYLDVLKIGFIAYIIIKSSCDSNQIINDQGLVEKIGEISIYNDLFKVIGNLINANKGYINITLSNGKWSIVTNCCSSTIMMILFYSNILYCIFMIFGVLTCFVIVKVYIISNMEREAEILSTEREEHAKMVDYLKDKVSLLKKILSHIPMPIFVSNQSSVEFATKKARALLEDYGLTRKREILKVDFIKSGVNKEQPMKLKDIILENKEDMPKDIRLERTVYERDLRYYDFKVDVINSHDEDMYIMVINDITKIKDSEVEQALNKFKAVMFASMSHEIRTPLNAIVNSCDVISSYPNVSDGILNCVEMCKSSASLLMYMTFNILDYSRMESGEFREEHIPFKIQTLLEKIAMISEPHARFKNLSFQLDIEEELDECEITNDERRIVQVLLNLIMNAIKYTKTGKVRLKIRLVEISVEVNSKMIEEPYLVFSVIDTGTGITEEKQNKLFKLFTNVDNFDNHTESTSIGLELTVSKNIVEFMGGCLWFTSQVNVGSVFTFAIPLDLDEDTEELDEDREIITQNLSRIIFDDPQVYFEECLKELNDEDITEEIHAEQIDSNVYSDDDTLLKHQNSEVMRQRNKSRLINMSLIKSIPESRFELLESEEDVAIESPAHMQLHNNIPLFLVKNASGHHIKSNLVQNKDCNSRVDGIVHALVASPRSRKRVEEVKGAPAESSENNNSSYAMQSNCSKKSSKSLKKKMYAAKQPKSYEGIKVTSKKKSASTFSQNRAKSSEKDPPEMLSMGSRSFKKENKSVKASSKKVHHNVIKEVDSKYEQDRIEEEKGHEEFEIDYRECNSESSDKVTEKFYRSDKQQLMIKEERHSEINESEADEPISPGLNQSENEEESDIGVDCDCIKILVVDDNPFNYTVLAMLIKNYFGIEVDTAADGFAAIDAVKKKLNSNCCSLYRIIFMDINMPEIDGFETTKRICSLLGDQSEQIKIIALTAMPWSELSDDLINAGMTHYIQKPIDQANLQKALQLFL